ncbi:MAG: hypothetical protein ACLFVJ_07295 [Persicimonas sp.]
MIDVKLPDLYPKQREAIYDPRRFVVIEASTKAGKTAGCIHWQLNHVLNDTVGGEHWWVAPVSSQARIAFKRVKRMLNRAGMRDHFTTNKTERSLAFHKNGAVWRFKTAEKPDNLFGEDVQTAVLDEASRMREESWRAVRSTLTATKGLIRFIGNVKGRGNWFYRLARKAESGAEHYAYYKLTAWDAVEGGILDREEVEQAKRDLPEHVFRELYLAEPADDGGNPFGLDDIDECIAPMSDAPPTVWGWDLAKSQDWTVGVALDADGAVCAFERFQRPWESTIDAIRRATGTTRALVDSTGVGDPVVETLQRSSRNYEGFKFTANSKQQLMEGLAMAIQRREIRFPEGQIVNELEVFEYEYRRTGVRYSAPQGLHDDCVCALALACKMRRDRTPRKKRVTKTVTFAAPNNPFS